MKRNNIYITLVTLLVLVTFSACKVGKSYTRPDLHLPDSLTQHQDSLSLWGYGLVEHLYRFHPPWTDSKIFGI